MEPVDQFIESWGQMGALWGINRSVARIHALLLASPDPQTLDGIAGRLQISRSNVSTGLKELRSWGVIRRVNRPGERRELFTCEESVWTMLLRIASERKRREFDPSLSAVRGALEKAGENSAPVALERLRELEQVLVTIDRIAERALANEKHLSRMLGWLQRWR